MAIRKKSRSPRSTKGQGSKKSSPKDARSATVSKSSSRSTVSGPTHRGGSSESAGDALAAKFEATQKLAADMPYNENKALEHGELSSQPQAGTDSRLPPIRQRPAAP